MASIKPKFRASSVAGREGSLYYQIIHERKPRQILTNYHILPSEWDSKSGRLASPVSSERAAMIDSLREHIRMDVELLNKIIRCLDFRGFHYSVDDIVEEFNRLTAVNSLFNFMQAVITRQRGNGKIRTSETYAAALNSFKKFREGDDIRMDTITSTVMEGYQGWLQHQGIAPNTISFYMRILRAVYNRAVEEQLVENRHPFRRVYTGAEKTAKRALPLAVIKKIYMLDLSDKRNLEFARDMFILSFMLRGMSFVDMAMLKKTDLKDGRITYRRRKTGQQLSIEWTKEMQSILDKWPLNDSCYLLPIIKNDVSNPRYVYKNMGERINKELKKVAEKAEIGVTLTMYVARHSWASIAKAEGIPIALISEGLGHEKESTTRIYLATLDSSAIDRANGMILGCLGS